MTTIIDIESRRLPVYLVLDCSASMCGQPIEAVMKGIEILIHDLCSEPWAQGMVWISIITFSNDAEQIIPLTEITKIPKFTLNADGMTELGKALKLLTECIDRDVRKRTSEHRGDYKPVIYLFTDGQPSDDDWEQAAKELRTRKIQNIIACALGNSADENVLIKITDTVIKIHEASPAKLQSFFRWVSQSVIVKGYGARSQTDYEEPLLPEGVEFYEKDRSDIANPLPNITSPPKSKKGFEQMESEQQEEILNKKETSRFFISSTFADRPSERENLKNIFELHQDRYFNNEIINKEEINNIIENSDNNKSLLINNKKLLENTNQEAESKEETLVKIDENVQFTVYRPQVVTPHKWYSMLAFAHLSERRPDAPLDELDPFQEVQRQAKQILENEFESFRNVTSDSTEGIPLSGEITFLPEIMGIQFNPPRATFLWFESVHRQDFKFRASSDLVGQIAHGRLTVFLGTRIVADVSLTIRVELNVEHSQNNTVTEVVSARPYRKVFPSYSHKDFAIVKEFEELASAFGDRYLRDSVTLRTGEVWNERLEDLIREADIFQLFWSSNSIQSSFVRNEWEHALSLNRQHFIRPVYWEEPIPENKHQGLPPEHLSRIHFQYLARHSEQIIKTEDNENIEMSSINDNTEIEASNSSYQENLASKYKEDLMSITERTKILINKGEYNEAQLLYQNSLNDLIVMEAKVNTEPNNTYLKKELSVSFDNAGKIYSAIGEPEKALEFFKKSLRVREEIAALDPSISATELKNDLSKIYNSIGSNYLKIGNVNEAMELFLRSLKLLKELVFLEPDRTDFKRNLSASFSNVGKIYQAMGEGPKALEFFEKSLKVMEELVTHEPSRNDFRMEYNTNKKSQASAYYLSGDYKKARQLLEELLHDNTEVVSIRHHLARLALITDNLEDLAKQTSEGWNLRKEARNYVVARILWFKLCLEYINAKAKKSTGIFGEIKSFYKKEVMDETFTILSQLKAIVQKENAIMNWAMQPVLDHIKPQIEEQQHALLSALVDAMSDKQNLEKLNEFEEWRDAKPQEIE